MTPASDGSLPPANESTRAATPPSPVRVWDTRWTWSAVPDSPEPPPETVPVPPVNNWFPGGTGVPMSDPVQPADGAVVTAR